MDHALLLNAILANTCPDDIVHDEHGDEWRVFRFDLHCNEVTILARTVETEPEISYEVKDYYLGYLDHHETKERFGVTPAKL